MTTMTHARLKPSRSFLFRKGSRSFLFRRGSRSFMFLCATVATLATLSAQTKKAAAPASRKPFTVVEATIPEMRTAMEQGRVTSRELVRQYLIRIATYEDRLHAAITVNPDALAIAGERDRERAQGKIRGPLHGIPVALKDNIHTTDMRTTGGALAFEDLVPPYEATITKNLKDAGAIILAKTTLTELANWVAGAPTPMPGNYNAINGQGFNPYDPRKDPREATFDGRAALNTGGSSSGAGTAASFWAANVGTETSGSVLSPSNQNMLAGIKPTVGRISRYGVIPITADQDTAGPMAKSVADVAIMFGVLESASPDSNDPATQKCTPPAGRDYTKFLNRDGLKGARIGIPRAFFYDRATPPGETNARGGLNDEQKKVMEEAIAVLKKQGAIIIDPADIPSIVDKDAKNNFMLWGQCSGVNEGRAKDENCSVDLKYGMKRDFNKWLDSLGAAAPLKSLGELIAYNKAHAKASAIKYGQSNLEISDEMDVEKDRARYEADRAKDIRLGGTHGIDEVMKAERLDAILFPGASGAAIAAKPGYPTVIVPHALVANAPTPAFPASFNAKPAPFGVSFTGMACSEPKLIELAYAFEQATKKRVPPPLFP
jgi:amidase